MKKRIHSTLILFCILIFLLSLNVVRFALIHHESLSTTASAQRKHTDTLGIYRGCIYDKNMIPLANAPLDIYSDIFGNDINMYKRYPEDSLCRHGVGYVYRSGEGAWGLEKYFDAVLKDDTKINLTYIKDTHGTPIVPQAVAKENTSYIPDRNLKTTIDYKIQKIAEEASDIYMKRGAVVIVDTDTFDVAAMVSRPNFDQTDVEKSFGAEGSPLMNKALCAYNAGSIFKTITAAAMLENNMDKNLVFECTGVYNADGKDFLCNKTDGHGKLDFKNAYAKSCNCFFYNGGVLATGEELVQTAEKFGLGKKHLNCDIAESNGILPYRESYSLRECANLSIGQGEILVTPLQAANMMAIVANGGIGKKINLADSITDKRGAVIQNLRAEGSERIISPETAYVLGDMMREAVLEGTAQSVQNGVVAIAGKTGTAQTGWVENGEIMTHGWFCGFFPYDNPKYAMAVFAENGKSGSEACIPLFRRIVLEINEVYNGL